MQIEEDSKLLFADYKFSERAHLIKNGKDIMY